MLPNTVPDLPLPNRTTYSEKKMTHRGERRRIDWAVLLPGRIPTPKIVGAGARSNELAALAGEALSEPSASAADRLLLHAVEFARNAIRLERSAIFVMDVPNRVMVGSWGTDANGATVDEHALTFQFGAIDREVFARAEAGFPWTVYDDCPLIAQEGGETRILGRGWVGCTAIRGPRGPLGIMFNDSALTHAPVDEAKQARAAVLCNLLGRALEPCRSHLTEGAADATESRHPIVRNVTRLLARDPTLSCEALAKQLHISAGWLARTFKREACTSVVEHRNELRLARFLERANGDADNLAGAALDAGFGSYAQFHRVFRARFGQSPRQYLLERRPAKLLTAPDASSRR
jgi:AraC-like DNA-binding protein